MDGIVPPAETGSDDRKSGLDAELKLSSINARASKKPNFLSGESPAEAVPFQNGHLRWLVI
jgi:hypothetical protein